MHTLRTAVLLGVALAAVFCGSAAAKIAVELNPHTATPGDEVQVKAGWGYPVGPVRRLWIYLLGPVERLGKGADVAERFGSDGWRRQVLVLDAAPDRRHHLRARFTVPNIPSGRYGVGVCVSEQECFPYGTLRVTDSAFETYMPDARDLGAAPRNPEPSRDVDVAGSSSVTAGRVVMGLAIVIALGCVSLALRRIVARREAA